MQKALLSCQNVYLIIIVGIKMQLICKECNKSILNRSQYFINKKTKKILCEFCMALKDIHNKKSWNTKLTQWYTDEEIRAFNQFKKDN